jgi:hypothetical protein
LARVAFSAMSISHPASAQSSARHSMSANWVSP